MTTEQLSFNQISSSSVRADQYSKLLALVREFPFRTARELSHKVNPEVLSHDNIHKRLPELRRMGKVANASVRACTITGKPAYTWVVA